MREATTINLIFEVMEPDIYGIPQMVSKEKNQVFAEIRSISAAEFFNAGRNGLRPEFRVDVFFADYDGQEIVELENGRQYEVYRKYYRDDDMVELYCQERGATNGENST